MRAAVVLLIMCCPVSVLSAPGQAPENAVTRKVLDNGLTLIVKPEPNSGLVAIEAIVKVGSAEETIQNAGIGNFVVQLLLAGTRQSSAEEIAAVADEVGGQIEARWHEDFTEIRAVTTSEMFNRTMRLIGECLTDADFEPRWVETVRAQLLPQFDKDSDDVFAQSYLRLRELLYQDNGYRRPALGFKRTVRVATVEDLRKFYESYYVPNNIVLSVVGDVTVKQALDRADKMFAGVSRAPLPRPRAVTDEVLERSKVEATEADLPAAYILFGWLAPPMTSADYAAMVVAANALGAGKGSLMFREIRQKQGIGYDLGVMYPKLKHQSHVVAFIITDPFKATLGAPSPAPALETIKSAVLQQVSSLIDSPLSERDLSRAKGYTIGTFALQQQRMLDRALQLGWFEAMGLGWETYWRFPSLVEKLTAQDVQKAAAKYFTNYAAYIVMPRLRTSDNAEESRP